LAKTGQKNPKRREVGYEIKESNFSCLSGMGGRGGGSVVLVHQHQCKDREKGKTTKRGLSNFLQKRREKGGDKESEERILICSP